MIIRGVTQVNDWMFGSGLNSYFYGEQGVESNVKTKLLEWVGDCFFNVLGGIDWNNRLTYGQQTNLETDIRTLTLACFGVTNVLDVAFDFDAETRTYAITLTIQTIYTPSATFTVTVPVIGVTP